MPQRLRVFISSPGDVPAERLRAALIVDKLAQEYSRFFLLDSYRWEYEPMLASGHFQDAIELPSAADIMLLILWSRLGTPLPEQTAVRAYRGIDGRPRARRPRPSGLSQHQPSGHRSARRARAGTESRAARSARCLLAAALCRSRGVSR